MYFLKAEEILNDNVWIHKIIAILSFPNTLMLIFTSQHTGIPSNTGTDNIIIYNKRFFYSFPIPLMKLNKEILTDSTESFLICM